jgi:hypothetical protein
MFDAIIFDLRDNGGGDPKMVALISSYLFDQPTHLTDIYDRKEDSITYIQDYFSGAEDFTYNLKNFNSGRCPSSLAPGCPINLSSCYLADMDVQSPETPGFLSLRLQVYSPPPSPSPNGEGESRPRCRKDQFLVQRRTAILPVHLPCRISRARAIASSGFAGTRRGVDSSCCSYASSCSTSSGGGTLDCDTIAFSFSTHDCDQAGAPRPVIKLRVARQAPLFPSFLAGRSHERLKLQGHDQQVADGRAPIPTASGRSGG